MIIVGSYSAASAQWAAVTYSADDRIRFDVYTGRYTVRHGMREAWVKHVHLDENGYIESSNKELILVNCRNKTIYSEFFLSVRFTERGTIGRGLVNFICRGETKPTLIKKKKKMVNTIRV